MKRKLLIVLCSLALALLVQLAGIVQEWGYFEGVLMGITFSFGVDLLKEFFPDPDKPKVLAVVIDKRHLDTQDA